MRDIIELSPHVLPFAPNCPEPIMVQYLREAAIDFCRRSRSWRTEPVFKLQSADADIALLTCCDSTVFEIDSVRWREDDGQWLQKLEPINYHDVEDYLGETNPRFFTQRLPNTLRVVPFQSGEVKTVLYLIPDQQAETLPDYIFELYPKIIASGALATILTLPGYDFTDAQLAMMHAAQFEAGCNSHFRDNARGQQRARTRTKGSYF